MYVCMYVCMYVYREREREREREWFPRLLARDPDRVGAADLLRALVVHHAGRDDDGLGPSADLEGHRLREAFKGN